MADYTVPTSSEYASPEDRAAFCMGFINSSEEFRAQYVELWLETLDNFTLRGNWSMQPGQSKLGTSAMDQIFLKDPETHKAIMTYAAKLVRSLFGDERGEFIQAEAVGWEDSVGAAPTVSRLLRYDFRLPGHFRTMVEAVIEMLLFGTGIIEVGWRYEEMELPIRGASRDIYGNEGAADSQRLTVPIYDDVDLSVIDVQDFYPDPGEYRIERMKSCAKRFATCLGDLQAKAARGIYDKAAIDKLKDHGAAQDVGNANDRFRRGIDQPTDYARRAEFHPLIGYEYWGEVPWLSYGKRAVCTIVDGEMIAQRPWPLADPYLPFKTLVINPTVGRFYGIAPGEINRYDQDFADVLKELIARAIIRMVHPPIAFDPDADFDPAMLRTWHVDQPIAVRGGPSAIGTLQYGADLQGATAILAATKQSMQEGTGAVGALTGEPGPSREAATAAAFRTQSAMDRPELAALLLERDCLPQIGLAMLRRNQQFLPDTEALAKRIGEMPEGMWIGDILAEFDVHFVGTRQAMTRQQKLQAIQTLTSMAGAIPQLAAVIPWDGPAIARMVGDILELPELAANMGDPATMALNIKLQQLMGGGAGAAPSPSAPEPAGLMPAQAAGAAL